MKNIKRLPKGLLPYIESITGIPARTVSDYISGIKKPGLSRAVKLTEGFSTLNIKVHIEDWSKEDSKRPVILSGLRMNKSSIRSLISSQKTA